MTRPRTMPWGRAGRLQRWMTGLLLAFAAGGVLAACVAAPSEDSSGFSAERAAVMFAAGYDSILARYVDKVDIGAVALEGLQGLAELDPAIAVERQGDKIELRRGGARIAEFTAPAADDAAGWADVTTAALGAATAASSHVAAASAEKQYQIVFDRALAGLDEFSRYAGAELASLHRAAREGFGGIGFEFAMTEDHLMQVTAVLPGTPAERGGLMPGDVITHLDDTTLAGLSAEEMSRRLRGKVDTQCTLTIRRAELSGPLKLTFTRALIVPPTVIAAMNGDIAYIQVSGFNQRTAASVAESFERLREKAEVKGVVLDLRNNPGGLLDQAVAVADLFLEKGEIVTTRGRHPDSNQRFGAEGSDIADGIPMAVLINGETASAAEVVAAALQDDGRAVVIGSNSYGKGTVQNVIRLPNDGELTLTWSHILAPSGYAFHHRGLMPSLCTSGAEATAREVLAGLRDGRSGMGPTLAAWRKAGSADPADDDELRTACPARHELNAADIEVACSLLEDPKLYSRALGISEPDRAVAQTLARR